MIRSCRIYDLQFMFYINIVSEQLQSSIVVTRRSCSFCQGFTIFLHCQKFLVEIFLISLLHSIFQLINYISFWLLEIRQCFQVQVGKSCNKSKPTSKLDLDPEAIALDLNSEC
jgi:hypothetical protein